jgi:hypothetical protein
MQSLLSALSVSANIKTYIMVAFASIPFNPYTHCKILQTLQTLQMRSLRAVHTIRGTSGLLLELSQVGLLGHRQLGLVLRGLRVEPVARQTCS